MRSLSTLLLCGFLAMVSAVILQAPPTRAMQPVPTPPSADARAFCSEDGEALGEARGIFDPMAEDVGVVTASDVEQPESTAESRRFTGNLRMNLLTLPPGSCLLGSLFYPAGLITVIDTVPGAAETIEIFVEPGPDGPSGAPAPEGSIWKSDLDGSVELTLPGPITVNDGDWVRLQNRAIVGFRNPGDADVTILVGAIHPTSDSGSGGCGGGCRSRP
jgi:hypothetical protein